MTTYAYPSITPNDTTIELVHNVAVYRSPSSNAMQTVNRGGELMRVRISHRNLKDDDRATMTAFLAKLNGREHRFTLPNHAENNRGNFGGTPLVAGADQLGNSIDVDGASLSVTNWIREGDFFGVGGELKICTADANSDGSGELTINFWPSLRYAPADNSAITTSAATGIFMLDQESVTFSNRPGAFSDFSFIAIEDVVA